MIIVVKTLKTGVRIVTPTFSKNSNEQKRFELLRVVGNLLDKVQGTVPFVLEP